MAAQQNGDAPQGSSNGDADLAQAFKDLARGEQTASALESHLDQLEAKIEELLAAANAQQSGAAQGPAPEAAQQSSQSSAPSSAEKEPPAR